MRILILLIMLLMACKSEVPQKSNDQSNAEIKTSNILSDTLTKYGIEISNSTNLGGLSVGDVAPDFTLKDAEGKDHNLYSILQAKPVILTFYRAHWCGYCTQALAELNDSLVVLQEQQLAEVLAISPELPEYSQKIIEEHGINFPLLRDENYQAMKDYKVLFNVTQDYQDKIVKYKKESILTFNGKEDAVLPIPATYVIGKDKKVQYVFYDPNYANRVDFGDLMAYF